MLSFSSFLHERRAFKAEIYKTYTVSGGTGVTYLLLEGLVVLTEFVHLALEPLHLVLLLQAALQSALTILEQTSLPLREVRSLDFLFNLGELERRGSFRQANGAGVVGKTIEILILEIELIDLLILLIKLVDIT